VVIVDEEEECKRPCDVVGTLKLEGNQMSEVRKNISGNCG
jgi:hypothetical protein